MFAVGEKEEVLSSYKSAALNRFQKLGLPSTKEEGWRHSPLGSLLRESFRFGDFAIGDRAGEDSAELSRWQPQIEACPARLVWCNGQLSLAKSAGLDTPGVKVRTLSDWLAQGGDFYRIQDFKIHRDDGFLAAVQADTDSSLVVEVTESLAEPLALFFLQDDTGKAVAQSSVYFLVADHARFQWIENYLGSDRSGATCSNVAVYAAIGASAQVKQYKLFHGQASRYLISRSQLKLKRGADFQSHFLGIGSALSRHEMEVELREPGATTALYGLFLGDHDQVVDCHTFIRHEAPHCTSQQLYKGALKGGARGVFRGRVLVDPGAQKTTAKQSNPNLVLSDLAQVHTKPQLEIFADDVKCAHGATIGKIDTQALFYLRSRGIPKAEAERILAEAFASEILALFRGTRAQPFAERIFNDWLRS